MTIKQYLNIIMNVILLTSIALTTIVYAAFTTKLQINGEIAVRVKEDIRITDLKITSKTGNVEEKYNNRFGKDNVSLFVKMPANSSITYTAKVTNSIDSDYLVKSIESQNKNSNIGVTISLKQNDLISKGEKSFTITLSNNTGSLQEIEFISQYKFQKEVEPTFKMDDLPTSYTMGNNYPVTYTYTVGESGLKDITCTSNVSGTITNLSTLSEGEHTITCTLTANSGKTKSESKKTTITHKPFQITNLVKDGSFENGATDWSLSGGSSIATGVSSHGNKSLLLYSSSSDHKHGSQRLREQKPKLNHLYYGRLMFLSSSAFSTSDCRFEWYYTDAPNALMVFARKSINTDKWTLLSGTAKITDSTYLSYTWTLRNFQVSPNSNNYTDELVIVDLTEAFGSGNEPTKAWCDENIKYFDTTTTIYK